MITPDFDNMYGVARIAIFNNLKMEAHIIGFGSEAKNDSELARLVEYLKANSTWTFYEKELAPEYFSWNEMTRFMTAVSFIFKLFLNLEDFESHVARLLQWTKAPEELIAQVDKLLCLIKSNPTKELDVYRLFHPAFNHQAKVEEELRLQHSTLPHSVVDKQTVVDARPELGKKDREKFLKLEVADDFADVNSNFRLTSRTSSTDPIANAFLPNATFDDFSLNTVLNKIGETTTTDVAVLNLKQSQWLFQRSDHSWTQLRRMFKRRLKRKSIRFLIATN